MTTKTTLRTAIAGLAYTEHVRSIDTETDRVILAYPSPAARRALVAALEGAGLSFVGDWGRGRIVVSTLAGE